MIWLQCYSSVTRIVLTFIIKYLMDAWQLRLKTMSHSCILVGKVWFGYNLGIFNIIGKYTTNRQLAMLQYGVYVVKYAGHDWVYTANRNPGASWERTKLLHKVTLISNYQHITNDHTIISNSPKILMFHFKECYFDCLPLNLHNPLLDMNTPGTYLQRPRRDMKGSGRESLPQLLDILHDTGNSHHHRPFNAKKWHLVLLYQSYLNCHDNRDEITYHDESLLPGTMA